MRDFRENQHDSFILNYLAIALAFTQEITYEKCVEPSTLCFIRWWLTRGQLNLLYSAVFVSNAVRSPSTQWELIIPSPGSQSVVFVYIGRSKDQLTYVLKSVYLFNRRHCHLETRTERETTETS